MARDPSPFDARAEAHLFVAAQPVAVDSELLFRQVGEQGLDGWVRDRIQSGPPCRGAGSAFVPDLGSHANGVSRRADGMALATYHLGPGRIPQSDGAAGVSDTDLLELEVREDGGLRLFCGRVSFSINGKRVASESLIAGLTLRALLAAAEVVATTGYGGAWDLGMCVTDLRGCHAFSLHDRVGSGLFDVPYSADTYEQLVRIESEILVSNPVDVLGSLYGRLHRGLSGGGQAIADLVARLLPP